MARWTLASGVEEAPPPEAVEAITQAQADMEHRVRVIALRVSEHGRRNAVSVSNRHALDVIDERISATRDRLADERDLQQEGAP